MRHPIKKLGKGKVCKFVLYPLLILPSCVSLNSCCCQQHFLHNDASTVCRLPSISPCHAPLRHMQQESVSLMLQVAHCSRTCECSERSLLYSMSLFQASESSARTATRQQQPYSRFCQHHLTDVPRHTGTCVTYEQLIAMHTVYNTIILASCIHRLHC